MNWWKPIKRENTGNGRQRAIYKNVYRNEANVCSNLDLTSVERADAGG